MDRKTILDRMTLLVESIPTGRVLSYGRLAELAGVPGQARLAAWFCSHLPDPDLPWHRVLSSDGRSRMPGVDGQEEQFARLWEEDVPLRSAHQVDMSLAMWQPGADHGDMAPVGF